MSQSAHLIKMVLNEVSFAASVGLRDLMTTSIINIKLHFIQ